MAQHTTPPLTMVPSSTPPVPITSIASAPYPVGLGVPPVPGPGPTPKIPPLVPVSTQAAVQTLMSQALRSPIHIKQLSLCGPNQAHKLTSHHVTPGGPIRRRNSEKYGLSLSTGINTESLLLISFCLVGQYRTLFESVLNSYFAHAVLSMQVMFMPQHIHV